MKKSTRFLAAALFMAATPAAGSQILNISAVDNVGKTVALGTGTWSVEFIGTSKRGATYDAWNPWSVVEGCDGAGMNCTKGWVVTLGIDYGYGVGNFDGDDGYNYARVGVPGDSHIYATPAAALLAAQTGGGFQRSPLPNANSSAFYVPTAYPIQFTLAAGQDVKFFVRDAPYFDNSGGVSIRLSEVRAIGVPEPASWAMLIAGFGLAGGVLRRQRKLQLSR